MTNNGDNRVGMSPEKQKRLTALLIFGIVAILLGILLLLRHFYSESNAFGVVENRYLIEVPLEEIDRDSLYITGDRRRFDGEMSLIIPDIGVDTPIGTSTEPEGLEQMPGLYEFSQMPDEPDGNVSIAGHRDIHGMEFYSLDQLEQGDSLYLLYQGDVYRYRLRESKIVQPDDWSVIKRQGFTSLTLTTCDPIGTTIHRLVVVGELEDVVPYHTAFEFS